MSEMQHINQAIKEMATKYYNFMANFETVARLVATTDITPIKEKVEKHKNVFIYEDQSDEVNTTRVREIRDLAKASTS